MVLDELAARFTGGAERFDRDGRFAAAGRIDQALLDDLLADPLFRRRPRAPSAASSSADSMSTACWPAARPSRKATGSTCSRPRPS